jgi:hypothetical protein
MNVKMVRGFLTLSCAFRLLLVWLMYEKAFSIHEHIFENINFSFSFSGEHKKIER